MGHGHIRQPCARKCVAEALRPAAERYPDLGPVPLKLSGLDRRDGRLATAIHRTVLQRWITLEFLLDRHLHQPMAKLEPSLRALFLSAAAQIVFMDRLPVHAVVNESVKLARELVRPAAGGLANAVLRKLAEQIYKVSPDQPWSPSQDRLPLDRGFLQLAESCLPAPSNLIEHLSIATSHPHVLIQRWVDQWDTQTACSLCLHGTANPPMIVAIESQQASLPTDEWLPHPSDGFGVWTGSYEHLVAFLKAHPARRVQDPASAQPVQSTQKLTPDFIVDYCAGLGTKTRQLAIMHPKAQVIATDIAPVRLEILRDAVNDLPNVTVVDPDQTNRILANEQVDLLLLDVPCSNTASLARRPEARYRFSTCNLELLIQLQRGIVEKTVSRLRRDTHLLYSTCSLEPDENQQMVQWIANRFDANLIHDSQILPSGRNHTYRDGSYHALLQL